MGDFLSFILALVIIIVAAKLSGYISTRFKQPSVLGELLAGVILGPTVFDMFHTWPMFQGNELVAEAVVLMAELGVIILMLLAGLELNISELLKSGKVASLSGILGVLLPLGMGYGTAILFGANVQESVFIALALAATSVSISAQTLLELDVLRSRVGLGLLGAAVFDDILVILSLSIAFIIWGGGGGDIGTILITLVQMVAYLGVASAIGIWVLPRLVRWIDRLPISEGTIAFVLVLTLLYSWAAEVLGGVATITGAFLVGLFLARLPFRERIEHGISTLAYGFFVPIFFVNIGLEVDMGAISGGAWWFALTLTAVAVISKLLGSGVGAKLGGLSNRESIQLGIGMISRGEVGLIVASFALLEGLISQRNFSITVFMVIVATLVTPPMLRIAFASESEPDERQPQVSEQPSQQPGD